MVGRIHQKRVINDIMNSIKERFALTYSSLTSEFVSQISRVNYDKIPQPFLPVCGNLYANAKTRIMFVGIETRGWGNISEFTKQFHEDPLSIFDNLVDEFCELEFCGWGNNFGKSFWYFKLKFLSEFYNLYNWKTLKRRENEDILKSFAWGNANSIERYHVTAQKKGVTYEDWQLVKNASRLFDKGGHLVNVFRPHIMVILNWESHEDWLQSETIDKLERQEIDEHFWYYYLPTTQTHILWTAHPMWLAKNKDFDDYIKYLVDFIKQKL